MKPLLQLIVDRFTAMVLEVEERLDFSGLGEEGVTPLRADEILRLYETELSELTHYSKRTIANLTIIAGEQRAHAKGIADAICARIIEVPVDQKLPSLYLLDSIVKNIGKEYIKYFSAHLPEVFCDTYAEVPPNMHPAMHHLFGTWSAVFPLTVVLKIEERLQFSPSVGQTSGLNSLKASESPRPAHGIQENLTKDDARQQFLRILKTLPYENSIFFDVRKIDDPTGLLPEEIILGINKRGVHFFRAVPKEYLHSAELMDIMQFDSSNTAVVFKMGVAGVLHIFQFETKQGEEICVALQTHINDVMFRHQKRGLEKNADEETFDDDCSEDVPPKSLPKEANDDSKIKQYVQQYMVTRALTLLNEASEQELKTLRGIGTTRAAYIIEQRSEKPFKTLEDLHDISMSHKEIQNMMNALTTNFFSTLF